MSNPIQAPQTTTIEITLTQEQKEVLENAATIRSLSLSEYLLEVALKLAEDLPLKPESIILSERDWEIVTSAIENPPEPNEALKTAIKKHQEKYGKW
ncbi:MAG TPA: DUF1778 domain-containing protein [Cyanobacteria bacterium UBA11369]|nr:DUF1778 domain-containing protein [Cyanobacteria bacterium UBA11371]HBE21451.1 DUF1778 domain-containing protein [Cyanobacteria bacterium UBA11367]HBE32098.1 DUF1778 domain-containing protein [Cyanobacteria bacterium UBA11368]HBE53698.1 DUF1778 domain-containing protein [Cyanobacteria bacterium UBA11369]